MADRLLDPGLRLLEEALLPEVGDGHEVEVEVVLEEIEARQERLAEPVGIPDARDAHALVGAGRVKGWRGLRGDDAGDAGEGAAAEVAAGCLGLH